MLIVCISVISIIIGMTCIQVWHSIGEFTFKPNYESVVVFIEGEKWRIAYDFSVEEGVGIDVGGWNLRVYDMNRNLVGGFPVTDRRNEKGIYYIHQGKGSYSIELWGVQRGFTFSFTVESYQPYITSIM